MARKKTKKRSMRDKVRNKVKNRNSGGRSYLNTDGVQFYKTKKGRQTLDILPYLVTVDNHYQEVKKGDDWCEREIFVHFNIGPEEKALMCPKTIGKPCPICKALNEAQRSGSIDEEEIKAQRAKKRILYNVIDLDDDEKKVQLWEISSFCFGQLLDEELDDSDEEFDGYADLVDGYSVKVRFKEESFGGRNFLKASKIDFVPRDDYDEDIYEQVQDLDAILKVLSSEEIEKIFLGIDDEDKEEPEEEEEEKPKKTKKRTPKKAEEEPEEEEPEEDTEDEESEEDTEEPDEDSCVACEGSGKSSNGRKCRICKGSGEKPEEKKPEKVCPEGLQWGTDCEEYDSCDDCDLWEDCIEDK